MTELQQRRNADNVNFRNNNIFGNADDADQQPSKAHTRKTYGNAKSTSIFGEPESPEDHRGRRIRPQKKDSDIFGTGPPAGEHEQEHRKHVNKDNVNYRSNHIFESTEPSHWETSTGSTYTGAKEQQPQQPQEEEHFYEEAHAHALPPPTQQQQQQQPRAGGGDGLVLPQINARPGNQKGKQPQQRNNNNNKNNANVGKKKTTQNNRKLQPINKNNGAAPPTTKQVTARLQSIAVPSPHVYHGRKKMPFLYNSDNNYNILTGSQGAEVVQF